MVRAEEFPNRVKLLDVLRNTKEVACLRLLLDYHGLQLLWSWMVDLEDVHLKAEIIKVLEVLPIPNKTMLKDSKVYDVIEKWSKSIDSTVKSNETEQTIANENKKLTNGDLLNEKQQNQEEEQEEEEIKTTDLIVKQENDLLLNDDKKEEEQIIESRAEESKDNATTTTDNNVTTSTTISDQKSSLLKNYNIIKKDVKSSQDQQQQKSMPNIALMASRLLNLWKDLKEVYRIPRLERQKRHEDEVEADRKAMENEVELNNNARLMNTPAFLRKNLKRPFDKFNFNNNYKQQQLQQNHQQQSIYYENNGIASPANKISKEEHRAYYNVELMRKDYEEAMKQYKKQIEQYNAAIQQQLNNINGGGVMLQLPPIQPPMPPAPPNIHVNQLNQTSSTPSPLSYQLNNNASSNLFNNEKQQQQQQIEFKDQQHTPNYNLNENQQQHYSLETDFHQSSYTPQQQQAELISYNHLYNYYKQPTTNNNIDVCIEEAQTAIAANELDRSWNSIYNELTGGLQSNSINCTNDQHNLNDETSDLQLEFHFKVEEEESMKVDSIYPVPGTYFVSEDKTYFIPCNSNGYQANSVIECKFKLPSKELSKRELPANWRYSKDKNGYIYYYNKQTNQVQWSAPASEKADQLQKINSISSNANSLESTSNIDTSSINLETLNEIIRISNGISNVDSSNELLSDPRKQRTKLSTTDDASQDQLTNNLSMELENKIIKFPYQQQQQPKKHLSERKIKEKFKNDLTEHIKGCLNPYRRHDCKVGKILCSGDFKYLARKVCCF